MYAKVIVDITHEKLDKVFEYHIPSHLEGVLKVGVEVVVPFGKGNRATNGYIVDICESCEYDCEKVKDILQIADKKIAMEGKMVALAAWMKENYGGTMIQALKTVLPIKKEENAKIKRYVRLLLDKESGEEKLNEYLNKKNQKARARVLAALLDNELLEYEFVINKFGIAVKTRDGTESVFLPVVSFVRLKTIIYDLLHRGRRGVSTDLILNVLDDCHQLSPSFVLAIRKNSP